MNREHTILELFEGLSTMRRAFAHSHGAPKDMPTPAQLCALLSLAHHGPQGSKELADKMHMTPSAATQLVDALVRDDLARREEDSSDRRKVFVSLTQEGERRLQIAKKHRMDSMRRMLDVLSDEELSALRDIQRKILTHFES